jgi:putative ABC transport system ATP-binding protein
MTTEPAPPAVEARGLSRTYPAAGGPVRGLRDVSLAVARGEVVAVTGPSGSGKSTLLFLLAGLDRPDGGEVRVAGTGWATLRGSARASFRRRTCGFIAQGMALLPHATAAENVEVPLLLDGVAPEARGRRVAAALEGVGLADAATKLPDQLSGGQQQRVAVARALVTRPAVVLADEPTANLDSAAAQAVTRLLLDAAGQRGAAVVLVTHDPEVARHAHRRIALRSGRVDPSAAGGRP